MIKAIVISSPRYSFLLKGFSVQWNRYCDIPIIPIITQETSWCGSLSDYIKTLAEDRILLVIDDYYLIEHYNKKLYDYLITIPCDKLDLQYQVKYFDHSYESDFLIQDQNSCYRQSTQISIWKKDYLLWCLDGSFDPWSFEINSKTKNDGRKIVGYKEPCFKYANIYLKGVSNFDEINKIKKEDRDELWLSYLPIFDYRGPKF